MGGPEGREGEILVPTDEGFFDYALRVSQALEVIEAVEGRSQLDILRDINLVAVDVLRLRAPEQDARRGSVLLDAGADLLDGFVDLVAAAASTAIAPQRVVPPRKSRLVEEYLKRIELGQSEQGSYVLTVLSPVEPLLLPESLGLLEIMEAPFPRLVTRNLANALTVTKETVETVRSGGSIETFREQVPMGISANFCEALHGMLIEDTAPEKLSLSVAWAPKLPEKPAGVRTFERSDAEVLYDGARLLREESPEEGVLLTGVVTNLHRDVERPNGIATIASVHAGRVIQLRTPLSEEDYEKAIVAHRDKKQVFLRANIERRGRQYEASEVSEFRLQG